MHHDEMVKPDLRREPRLRADGSVTLRFDRHRITGQLMDVSSSGFRAAHDCPHLRTGATVHFRHEAGSGRARVVWNRISGGSIESGFFIAD